VITGYTDTTRCTQEWWHVMNLTNLNRSKNGKMCAGKALHLLSSKSLKNSMAELSSFLVMAS
jgi:hypothetical protein